MLSYSELKKGEEIVLDGQPYEIIEANSLFKGRGSSVLQAKIKNLINGNVLNYTFRPSDTFQEAEILKIEARFLYSYRNKFFFSSTLPSFSEKNLGGQEKNPAKRFDLTPEQIGKSAQFLKPNQIVEGIEFEGKIINISLPIKVQLKVVEAPPGLKGNRAESGTKQIALETGAKINAPLFIKEGDIIEVNTETEEYVRRIE